MLFNLLLSLRAVDIRAQGRKDAAGVAQLGQRRWDEVPVRNGSQVQILPSALIDIPRKGYPLIRLANLLEPFGKRLFLYA